MIPNIPAIKNPEKYPAFEIPREKLEFALAEALKKIDKCIEQVGEKFPHEFSVNNVYKTVDNVAGWGNGFWSGILWHAYQLTGNEKYKSTMLSQIPSWTKRITEKIGVNHHDMGFLYSLSCVAAYKLCGNEEAKAAAIMAADHLCTRYQEKGQFIQAWGNVSDPKDYRLIIDCLLNIPLLYWASQVTGDPKYETIAWNHFNSTVEVCCRADASTYHTYYFDPETGLPVKGVTHQGAFDDSAWARGQTWGTYGPLLTYIYKKSDKALQVFKATTNYFLNEVPEDYIAYWDLVFKEGTDEPRDTSSNAIAMCAMLEGIKHMDKDDPLRQIYINACNIMMNELIDNYISKDVPESNGLLLHQTYAKPQGIGIDEHNIWGDYFYFEALHRMLDPDWELYW
ncbi:MAG: glycoside hydrolase family 88 protein [Clostridia bacterium]|nr:glycoside hydrolase family 88 protein [Clostridia bacterium]MBQ8371780.1 glycoside hydrolase family 88 protein [Clostridia bacterium]